MNKNFRVKYDHVKKISYAISELASCLGVIVSVAFVPPANSSWVSNKYDYQVYLDLAENKGAFQPGRTNIPLYSKDNHSNVPDYIMSFPMPDFSSVNQYIGYNGPGVGVLLHPQFIGTAAHVGTPGIKFGDTVYKGITNNYDKSVDQQYLRLSKMVVESAPAYMIPSAPNDFEELNNKLRFPLFSRLGSGTQYLDMGAYGYRIAGGYAYLTGGLADNIDVFNQYNGKWTGWQGVIGNPGNNLPNSGNVTAGDSGSPFFGWDKKMHRWEVIGAVSGTYTFFYPQLLDKAISEAREPDIFLNGKTALWETSTINDGVNKWSWQGIDNTNKSLSATKNLYLYGGGDIFLTQSVNQGAGGLYFDNKQQYSFRSAAGHLFWTGSGLNIGEGTTVNWYLPGVINDNLHKIGMGTLVVKNSSPGGIKVGEGLVRLDSDTEAFSKVYITGGKGIVSIDNPDAFSPDNIYFGYRGGVLDLNGHDAEFKLIKAEDGGAIITNSSQLLSSLTIKPENLGTYVYSGHITGNINIDNDMSGMTGNKERVFNGGLNTTGVLTQNSGALSFQGQPVVHAVIDQRFINTLNSYGDKSVYTEQQRFEQPDWETHTFELKGINADSVQVNLARNAVLNADIYARNSALNFGSASVWIDKLLGNALKKNDDYQQDLKHGESVAIEDHDKAIFRGSIHSINSPLTVENAILDGASVSTDMNSPVLMNNSRWSLSADSDISQLLLNNTPVYLSGSNNASHLLNVDQLTSNNNVFVVSSKNHAKSSDSLNIKNVANGTGNQLKIDLGIANPWQGNDDVVLASAPATTAHDYFSLESVSTDIGTYLPYFSTKIVEGKRIWYISPNKSRLNVSVDWSIPYDYYLKSESYLSSGVGVTLSSGSNELWHPVNFNVDYFSASDVKLYVDVNPGANETSNITINNIALGTGVKVVLNWLLDGNILPSYAPLVIASAPEYLSNNYFTFSNNYTNDRAGYYVPSVSVSSVGDVKNWILDPINSLYVVNSDWTLNDNFHFPGGVTMQMSSGEIKQVNLSGESSGYQPHSLIVNRLISGSVDYNLYVNNEQTLQPLQILKQAVGNGLNRLLLLFTDDKGIKDIPDSPDSLVLASAPAATADDYFIPAASSTALGDYLPSLSVGSEDGKKRWILDAGNSSFTLKHDWNLTGDSVFTGLMEMNAGVKVALSSAGAGWTPHTLSLGRVDSGGNNFSLYASRDAGISGRYNADRIDITEGTLGSGNNPLSLTFLEPNGSISDTPGSPDSLVLASAPAATADDYFIPAASSTALGDYLPSLSVGSEDGKKRWILDAGNSSFTLKHDWNLTGDSVFTGLMEMNAGVKVALSSAGAGWMPHTLSLGKLSSEGNDFHLNVGSGKNDVISIDSGYFKSTNNLIISQQQDAISESSPVGEWLVAKAPAYAPSEYFSIKSSAINGQNKIITATEVIGTKKNWWAVGQQSNSTWFLESSRHFNELNMFLNDISLSPSSIFGWKPKELVVDKLQAYGTTFHFTIDPGSSVADQLVLNKSPVGGGNNFSIRYLDHADSRNINHHELLIARAPSETKGGYFTPFIKYDNETPFSSALATTKNELEEQWWIITFDKDKNWFVDHDKHFETLNLNSSGLNVSLSGKNGNIWKPHTFTVDYLSASNVNFNITANLQTLQSDKIIVNKSATGGNNYLNVSFMLDSNLPVQFKSDIVLAQAPVATNNTYFTVSPVLKGLSIYTPEFSIITSGEKKEWRLTHNTVDMTALTPAKETVPMTALTPAKETVPMTALTPAKETVPMTALTPAKETVPMTALTPAKENTPDSDMQSFAETFFTKKNNIKLINHLSNLMALPQINFVQESNQLNKRLGDIRQLNEPNGFWIKSDTGRAKYEDMKISHQTIQMGGDKKISEHIYGVMLTHTLGNSSGEDSEEHTTLGGGGYYSWVPENGLFLDVVSKYLRTNQTWFTDSSLQRNNSTRIEMLMGSIQTGWRFTSPAGWGFIEPSVELFGGYSSGFTIKGDNIKASSQHSLPLYSKSGFSAGVNWLPDSQRQISLSTGIYKLHALYSPGEVNLSEYSDHNNKWSSLKYSNGKKDNSYLIDLSINVRLSDEWRIYAQTSTSVGGIIHDNYNGQLGLRYQF